MSLSSEISREVKARPAAVRKDAPAIDFSMYLDCFIVLVVYTPPSDLADGGGVVVLLMYGNLLIN